MDGLLFLAAQISVAIVIVWTVINGAGPGMLDKPGNQDADCASRARDNARARRKSRPA
jgi:hypothetical protein